MTNLEMPDWYHKCSKDEQEAVQKFLSTGGKLSSWGYMAPELKAPFYPATSTKEQD